VRNAAETFGWTTRTCWRRWENFTTRGGTGGPVRLVKGPVIVDDTVDHNTPGRREPLGTTGNTATPTGGSRGSSSSRSP